MCNNEAFQASFDFISAYTGPAVTRSIRSVQTLILFGFIALATSAKSQAVTIDVDPRTTAFEYQAATPISPTSVIQMYFGKVDSGAMLAYAVVIRGPAGWYNAKSRVTSLPAARVPAGGIGEHWQVGERRYEVLFDPSLSTLSLFDTTVSLTNTKVVLVTLPPAPNGKAEVRGGVATDLFITRENRNVVMDFLRKAMDVRAFASIQ